MKKITDFLTQLPMTLIGGTFLALSLILKLTKITVLIDPAWITILISGVPILYYAIKALIFEKQIDSTLLISIAIIACIYINEIFAAGEIVFIMAIGEILEEMTIKRARKGLKKLISLVPQQGRHILFDGTEEIIEIEKIKKHDIFRVLPGETIPVDGDIISGNTSIDQSIITGESLPVDKGIGDNVFSGTINRFGSIDIKATKVGQDSSLQKLIQMVEEAENNKAPTERILDKWASWLVPVALLIAIITYLITKDTERSVTVLVVFCPCALVLATPTAIMAAIGQATKHGVIIKSGNALENMGKVNCIAFDKTGTLTYGNLIVTDIISFMPNLTERELLKLIASIENHSEHPLAKAILNYSNSKNIEIKPIENFQMTPGKGVMGEIDGEIIICGNDFWLQESNVVFDDTVNNQLEQLRKEGKAAVIIAKSNVCIGLIGLSDELRETAKNVITELKKIHINTFLLTGDNNQTAEHFASKIGITDIYSKLLPDQKVKQIQKLQQQGKNICMIGDGINDAPALKTANVGIAMGTMGSDIAIDAADIALMSDDISKIPYLKKLSNATTKTIKFSISLSIAINIIAVTLSTMGLLNPTIGALVHNAGAVFVVLIASFLYDKKI